MKKILSILLIIALVFSLAACGSKPQKDNDVDIKNPTVSAEESVTEDIDVDKVTDTERPELEYKLAAVYEKEITYMNKPAKEFCFVLEYLTPKYYTMLFEIHDKNGKKLEQYQDYDQLSIYQGRVCKHEDREHLFNDDRTLDDHRVQDTIFLTTFDTERTIEDFVICSYVYYDEDYDNYELFTYEPNAEFEELTIENKYAYGGEIVNLDGSYYAIPTTTANGSGGSIEDHTSYRQINHMKLIKGEEFSGLKGETEVVNRDGQPYQFPDKYKKYIEFFKDHDIGYRVGAKYALEDRVDVPEDFFLKYTDTNGKTIIFFL